MLVDSGSSIIIIQLRVLNKRKAEEVMKLTLSQVMDGDKGYNVIIDRPWIHNMKDVPLTYLQLLKFPMPNRIKQIRGDQSAVKEINAIIFFTNKVDRYQLPIQLKWQY